MNYSSSDIGNMRRDALRRTREMHRQNTEFSDTHNTAAPEIQPEAKNDNVRSEPVPQKHDKKTSGNTQGFMSGIFSSGKPDNDKIIIIALILILAKEGADLKLLIALGYILM